MWVGRPLVGGTPRHFHRGVDCYVNSRSAHCVNVCKTLLEPLNEMPSGRSRTRYRMYTCGNRKLCTTRWIGQLTVRVGISRVNDRGCAYVKAGEGAEKSCLAKRRRKRGLRHGKRRSRGGKPRRSAKVPAPRTENGSVRANLRRERMFSAARRSQGVFLSSMESLRDVRNRHVFQEAYVSRQRSDLWNSLKAQWGRRRAPFPRDVQLLVFGRTFLTFMKAVDPAVDVGWAAPRRRDAPPLPPRPGVRAQPVSASPPWHVSTTVDRSRGESDHLGPDPCAWCRDEWIACGELGRPWARCMRIHSCVRRDGRIERENARQGREERLHRSNARRYSRR
jgi:hypothetical protein